MAFKVLIYHKLAEETVRTLEENGVTLKLCEFGGEAGMIRDIADCDAVVLYEQPENGFNRKIIDAGKKLKLIARDGVGYETVDVRYAEEQGIFVTNTPRTNNISVAEATVMMMIACNRNIQKIVDTFRQQRCDYEFHNSDPNNRGYELAEKTLGLVGCGSIGQSVAYICARGLQMKVFGYDPYAGDIPAYIGRVDSMEKLLGISDYVSLHLPSTDSTRGSFGMEQFRMMKRTAYFINAARGDIVREAELIEAIKTGVIAGAGLDVYQTEPIAQSSYELFELDRVFLLPHCAAFTWESNARSRASLTRSLLEAAGRQTPAYRVNNPANPRLFSMDG